ncbi:hypothetical protein Bca4012_009562 [Brassica carinata]
MKPDGKSPPIKNTGKIGVSSTNPVSGDPMSKKPNGKAVLHSDSSAKADEVLFFKDVEFGPQEGVTSGSITTLRKGTIPLSYSNGFHLAYDVYFLSLSNT